MTLLLPTLIGLALQDRPSPSPGPIPRDVIIVSPRPLTEAETTRVNAAIRDGHDATLPELGSFKRLEREKRLLAISDGYLRESRYDLTERALARLTEIWRPRTVIPLEGEKDLREWLSASVPPDKTGKASNDAPALFLTVGARIRLEKDGFWTSTNFLPHDLFSEGDFPMPTKKSPPRPRDGEFDAGLPAGATISFRPVYDPEETSSRFRLAAVTLEQWHRDHLARLREKAKAFFARADADLAARFGGRLPIGSSPETLNRSVKSAFLSDFTDTPTYLGFRDSDQALAWASSANIREITPAIYATLPVYSAAGRSAIVFRIVIP